jgi:superoxide dismutase, Fe-Mn family
VSTRWPRAELVFKELALSPSAIALLINGLKREELIAANSMILHELYFAGLGDEASWATIGKRAAQASSGSLRRD